MLTDLLVTIIYYAWIVAMIISMPIGICFIFVMPIMKIWDMIKGEDDYYEED